MNKEPVQQLPYIFFSLYILLQVFLILFSNYNFGPGGFDNIRHYQNARFSFSHPELFLDLLGKPLYTTLTSPFALLGFRITRSFNLIVSVLILLFTLKITDRLYKNGSLFSIVLLAFSPVYFFLSTSCLPDLLFGFILIAGIYFMVENKPSLSALIISFLPLESIQGFLIIFIFALVLMLIKSYRSILLLLTGTIIFSLASYFVFGDIQWLTHPVPNSGGRVVADTSGLIGKINFNLGFPLLLLLITGFGIWLTELSDKFSLTNRKTILFLLVSGCFLALFSGILFSGNWKEYEFLTVALIPLAAIIGGKTVDFFYAKVENGNVVNGIFIGLVVIQVVLLFTTNKLLLKQDDKTGLAKKGANFLRFNEPDGKLYYFNPLIPFYLDIDPFDSVKSSLITENYEISENMDWDDLLVWDSEFGKMKYDVDLKSLEDDSNLEKLESFYLHDKTVEISKDDISVQIFKKSKVQRGEFVVPDTYEHVLSFEDYINPRVNELDGVKVWTLDSTQEYSPNIVLAPEIVNRKEILEFMISVKYKAIGQLEKGQVLLVFSAISEGKNIHYKSEYLISSGNKWEESEMKVTIPELIPGSSKILIYVWNKERRQLDLEKITVNARSYYIFTGQA